MTNLKSSNNITNILFVANTDKIMARCAALGILPSQNSEEPTDLFGKGISDAIVMIASNEKTISGGNTANLVFAANVGDVVRFTGLSEYNNFDNPVIVYAIKYYDKDRVFGEFRSKTYEKEIPVGTSGSSALPSKCEENTFNFFTTDIIRTGTEAYNVHFAIYKLNTGTGDCGELYGYFKYDPSVVVES